MRKPGTRRPKPQRLREQLLEQIACAAKHCQELEQQFGASPPPALETLIKVHRVLALNLSTEANVSPELWTRVAQLMKPVLAWARLEELQRERALAEQKYRDQVAAQKAAIQRELEAGRAAGGISPETLERVERELRLL